jgi:hypothetical protein
MNWRLRFYLQGDLFHVDMDWGERDAPVRLAMHRALRQAGYSPPFDGWELRTPSGFVVDDDKRVSGLISFDFNVTRKAGTG